jgi:predicted nucleic-acid-binding protein
MKKNKKFTWWNYILFTFTIKKNNFLEFLKNKREDYISEEKLLELTFFYEKNYDFKKDYEKLETNNMEDNNIYNISTNTITPVPLTLNK